MKGFFVMVLVLVTGAVPCLGRTVSEGAVFYKTQPHESMKNVTFSSSKLESYVYLHLALQWPRSYCHLYHCNREILGRFTVHGLWPHNGSRGYVDCEHINRHYRPFRIFQRNVGRFVPRLSWFWPDLTTVENWDWGRNNQGFWGREFNKHGKCTFWNQFAYFEVVNTLVGQLGELVSDTSRIIGGPGLVSGGHYSSIEIREAVRRATNRIPMLHCFKERQVYHLWEIRFCVNIHSHQLEDCNWNSNCGRGRVLLL